MYNNLNLSADSQVIYTGPMNYFKNSSSNQALDLNGNIVQKSDISTPLNSLRSIDNLPAIPYAKYPIDDPLEWANQYYEGPFVGTSDYKNEFENYCKFRTTYNFMSLGYSEHCGPTAITNLMEMIGAYKRYPQITNLSYQQLFKRIADYGEQNKYFVNGDCTYWDTEGVYIIGCFDMLNLTARVTDKTATFANIKSELTNHRPFYLTLYSHPYYRNHAVVGYAYNRAQSETTGDYLSFVKIADGWNTSGRYLDIASIQSSNQATLRAVSVS